jgi:hypothetical protein
MAEFIFKKPDEDVEFLQYEVHRLPNGVLATCVQWSPDILEWNSDRHQKHSDDFGEALNKIADTASKDGPITSWESLSSLSRKVAGATRYRKEQWREKLFMHGYGIVVIAQAETRDDPTIHPYIDYETSGNVGVAVTSLSTQPEAKYIKKYIGDTHAFLSESHGHNFPVALPVTAHLGPSSAIEAMARNNFRVDGDTRAHLGSLTLTAN